MYMKDWIEKLDDFMNISNREVLKNAGKITAQMAKHKADTEYEKYQERAKNSLTPVEQHFLQYIEQIEKKLIAAQKIQREKKNNGD